MVENPASETGGGFGAGVLSLFLSFPVAVLFNTFVQSQDLIVLLLVLVGFGGCIVSLVKYALAKPGVSESEEIPLYPNGGSVG